MVDRDWAPMYDNMNYDQADLNDGYRSVIASCSAENGIEPYKIYYWAVDGDDFLKYLKFLRRQNPGKIAIFMDNLGVHKV